MEKIQIVNREQMLCIEKKDIDDIVFLYKKLAYNMAGKTAYILEKNKIVGIVTHGGVRQYLRKEKAELIDKEFPFFFEKEKDKVVPYFKNNPSIYSVPIVDSDMNLMYGYIKSQSSLISETVSIYYFFDFLHEIGVCNILCSSKNCVDWINGALEECKVDFIHCQYMRGEDLGNGYNNTLIICEDSKEIKSFENTVTDEYTMHWRTFESMMYFPWTDNWRQLIDAWCKNVSRYISKLYICSKRRTSFSERMISCLKKYMPISIIHSLKDVEDNVYILSLEMGIIENVDKATVRILYIEDCIYEYLAKYQMYYTMEKEIIPMWKNGGVHVLGIEDPCDRRLLQSTQKICLLPPDAYALGKVDELKRVFGKDISDIINGKELTILKRGYAQERVENHPINEQLPTIFLFGPCIILGAYVKVEDTISSVLQKQIGSTMCVRNLATGYWGNMLRQMRSMKYKKGDIVLFFKYKDFLDDSDITIIDIQKAYTSEYQDNIWDNLLHCNGKITHNIADIVFNTLKNQGLILTETTTIPAMDDKGFKISETIKEDLLDDWYTEIKGCCFAEKLSRKQIGAIVMNCNPFTLGHKYLIREASSQVDILYVFVVSENKSYFDFSTRYNMVKEGVAEYDNVTVLPSGPYIISNDTMNGYFIKDKLQTIQPVEQYKLDLRIFGAVIAPKFGISVRFVGEEPVDIYTNSYNQAMKVILPEYNIEVIELPRVCYKENVISASTVRTLIKEERWDEVIELVPQTTLKYISGYRLMLHD